MSRQSLPVRSNAAREGAAGSSVLRRDSTSIGIGVGDEVALS